MAAQKSGLDETKYTLSEHLTELRGRLVKSLLAVLLTTSVAISYAPELLDYTIAPLQQVLKNRTRVETVLVHKDAKKGGELAERLESHAAVKFHGRIDDLVKVRELVVAQAALKKPIELVLVSTDAIGDDGALVSDLLDDVEPQPEVVYLVANTHDPAVPELQLEGATLIPDPPRKAALERIIRRSAAAAGKSASADKLVVLSPLDPFFAYLKVALVVGLFLACPIWLFQAWRFVAPGLYASERLVVMPAVLAASVMFVAGGLFAYFLVFPVMFDVLVNDMMPANLAGAFTVDKYLSLLMTMTIAFGVVFEMPLVIALLAMIGVVTPAMLRKVRKLAIVGSFVFAAVITPTTDPLSLMLMAVPLVLFYEIGIVLASIVHRRRQERRAAVDEAMGEPT
ncbi:twin-arginine translocase subunit TatC [Myxococcota bacterium]|nr:twin-arginine translocase subunit TatC [Myxococcota bacterium]